MHATESKKALEFANTVENFCTSPRSGPIPADNSETDSSSGRLPEVEIEFAELQDGSLVEMIADPADQTKFRLAIYKNETVRYAERWADQRRTLVPLSRADEVSQRVQFPDGTEPYAALAELQKDIMWFFKFCLDVDEISTLLMTALVFSTWLPEKLPFAPYLAFVAPPGCGKSMALRILSLLCRRSLLTADVTSAAFYDVSHRISPTILIDETRTAGDPRTLFHLLRSSSSRGLVGLRKNTARLAYGPKVLAWNELPNDAALNSRCIIVPLHKTSRKDLQSPDDPRVAKFAEHVRRRLLQFRFENYRRLSIPEVPANVQLSARALDLYRALAFALSEDVETCETLAHFIAHQRQFQPSLLSTAQASVVRAVYGFIHGFYPSEGILISELTEDINTDLALHGEPATLTERKVGDVLTSLGLTNRSRKNVGYVLWLDRADRKRIHEMARDYDVDVETVVTLPVSPCEMCPPKGASVASQGPGSDAIGSRQPPSEEPRGEHRERRELRLGGGARPDVHSAKPARPSILPAAISSSRSVTPRVAREAKRRVRKPRSG